MMRTASLGAAVILALWGVALQGKREPEPEPPPLPPKRPRVIAAPRVATAPRVVAAPRAPSLKVTVSPERPPEPLRLTRGDVDVVIAGYVAQTTMTLTFHNHYPRILEGELVFPLPEGAVVSGYGLDVGGEMVDGVIVERHEARIAFETEVRGRVDPGLVEWVQGNNFRTRVWPIPAHGSRTIKVQYLSDLVSTGAGGEAAFHHLSLGFGKPVDRMTIHVRVIKGTVAPEVRGGSLKGLEFERWEEGYAARTTVEDVDPGDLEIVLPSIPREVVAIEESPGGEAYFVVNDFPTPSTATPRERPRRVGLFWDASLSGAGTHSKRERTLLEGWLQGLGAVEVAFVAFRDRPEPVRTFDLPADLASLLRHADGLPYDGGTHLGSLRFTRECAYHVLFSDGLANLGDTMPAALEAPVYTVAGDAQANHPLLREIGQKSGGAYLNLQRLDDAAALSLLGAPVFSFLGADHARGEVAELQPGSRQAVQGRFTLAGRLLAAQATLTARFGTTGGGVVTGTYTLRRAEASAAGGLIPRLWAQQKVAALSVFPEQNHAELLATGREFGLVTPGTSLLVLETVEQYVQHGIEPPASRPLLHAEYLRRRKGQQHRAGLSRDRKLEHVVRMWEEEVRWWENDFPNDPLRIYRDRLEGLGYVSGGVEGGVPGGVVGGVVGGLPAAPRMVAPGEVEAQKMLAEPLGVADAATRIGGAMRPITAKEEDAAPAGGTATIAIRRWDPRTPYLAALRRAGPEGAYDAYFAERETYGTSPAFFLDCADHLMRAGQRDLGVRVLTSVVELQLEEPRLLRITAHRLQQAGELDLAIGLFDKVRRLRPEEPQSLRDLALALAARADALRARSARVERGPAADYLRAIDLLNEVVLGQWDGRFPRVEVLALLEINRIVAILERGHALPADGLSVDPRLVRLLDTDVRIVLTWDTDQTDMDLWVVEPTGEKCFYSHPVSTIGGRLSQDFTGGYGPEEYAIRRARPGRYQVKANYYGSREQGLSGPTTVQATIITDFGRPQEKRRAVTLRLTEAREVVDVGEVRLEGTHQD